MTYSIFQKQEQRIKRREARLKQQISAIILVKNNICLLDLIGDYIQCGSWTSLCVPLIRGTLTDEKRLSPVYEWKFPYSLGPIQPDDRIWVEHVTTGQNGWLQLPRCTYFIRIVDTWKSMENPLQQDLLVLFLRKASEEGVNLRSFIFVALSTMRTVKETLHMDLNMKLWSGAVIRGSMMWLCSGTALYCWKINLECERLMIYHYSTWSLPWRECNFAVSECLQHDYLIGHQGDKVLLWYLPSIEEARFGSRTTLEITSPSFTLPSTPNSRIFVEVNGVCYHQALHEYQFRASYLASSTPVSETEIWVSTVVDEVALGFIFVKSEDGISFYSSNYKRKQNDNTPQTRVTNCKHKRTRSRYLG